MALDLNYTPVELVSTENMSEADWLEWRRKGIGGSDSSAVMGFSPFRTTRDLYYDKVGIRPAVDDEPNWVTLKVGHLLEPLVAEIFSRQTGYRVYQVKTMFQHPLYPFMLADVDYFIETDDGRHGLLECKTSNQHGKEKWADDTVPYNYELQCRHYMAVLNVDFVWIACLFSNTESEFIKQRIDRDLDLEEELIANEKYFWENYVQAHVEPPYTEDGDLVLQSLRSHYGPSTPTAAEFTLSPKLEPAMAQYVELHDRKLKLDAESKRLDSQMKKTIAPVLDELGTQDKGVLRSGNREYHIVYASQYRRSFPKESMDRLKADYPALYDDCVKQTECRSITVKCRETA